MSRLDSFIRRMLAQRACLNWAAEAVADIAGPVLELGLGNGRTYDHLREILPERDIYVFEREIRAHALSLPPERYLILGDIEDTLISAVSLLPAKAALAHVDLGTSDAGAYEALALRIGWLLKPLMKPDGIIVSNVCLRVSELISLDTPSGVKPGRYYIYRVSAAR
jgi:SAM-dependent methyltransferase